MKEDKKEEVIQYKVEKNKKKKEPVGIIVIAIIVVIAIILIRVFFPLLVFFNLANFLSGDKGISNEGLVNKYNSLSVENRKKKYSDIYEYQQKVTKYLKEKYNREFEVNFYSKGYKSKGSSLDGSYFECGHDKNIEEYVFEVKTELPFVSYITLWKNMKTSKIEISEVDGTNSNNTITSYKRYLDIYNIKLNEEENIKNIVNGKYSINMFEDPVQVFVILNNDLEKEYKINDDSLDNMITELKNIKELEICFKYKETKISLYEANRKVKTYKAKDEITSYLDNNFEYSYTTSYKAGYNDILVIKVNKNLKENIIQYKKLVYGIAEIIERYKNSISYIEVETFDAVIEIYGTNMISVETKDGRIDFDKYIGE